MFSPLLFKRSQFLLLISSIPSIKLTASGAKLNLEMAKLNFLLDDHDDDPIFDMLNNINLSIDHLHLTTENTATQLKKDLNEADNLYEFYIDKNRQYSTLWGSTDAICDFYTPYLFDSYFCVKPSGISTFVPTGDTIFTISMDEYSVNITLQGGSTEGDVGDVSMVNTTSIKQRLLLAFPQQDPIIYQVVLNSYFRFVDNGIKVLNLGYPAFHTIGLDGSVDPRVTDPLENIPVSKRPEFTDKFLEFLHSYLNKLNLQIPLDSAINNLFSPYYIRNQNGSLFILSKLLLGYIPRSLNVGNPYEEYSSMYACINQVLIPRYISSIISPLLPDKISFGIRDVQLSSGTSLVHATAHFDDSWFLFIGQVNVDAYLEYSLYFSNASPNVVLFEAYLTSNSSLDIDVSGCPSDGLAQQAWNEAKDTAMNAISAFENIQRPLDFSRFNCQRSEGVFVNQNLIINLFK
jgi:hypothetical protein